MGKRSRGKAAEIPREKLYQIAIHHGICIIDHLFLAKEGRHSELWLETERSPRLTAVIALR